jgi:spore maturation protein SpmB
LPFPFAFGLTIAFSGLPLSVPPLVLVVVAFFTLVGALDALGFVATAGLVLFGFDGLLDFPFAVEASASGTELSPLDMELRSLSAFGLELIVRSRSFWYSHGLWR